jgi:hypothetical protein
MDPKWLEDQVRRAVRQAQPGEGGAAAPPAPAGNRQSVPMDVPTLLRDLAAVRQRVAELEFDNRIKEAELAALIAQRNALRDEGAAHPDRGAHPLANDKDARNRLYARTFVQKARELGIPDPERLV